MLSNGFGFPVRYLPYVSGNLQKVSPALARAPASVRRRCHRHHHDLTQPIARGRKKVWQGERGLVEPQRFGLGRQQIPSVSRDACDKMEQPVAIGTIGGVGGDVCIVLSD